MNIEELRKNLKLDSGYLTWSELENHFARGIVRVIATNLKFFDHAINIAQNNSVNISVAIANNEIFEPTDAQALQWQKLNSRFLCVVVAPFVLIQESDTKSK